MAEIMKESLQRKTQQQILKKNMQELAMAK